MRLKRRALGRQLVMADKVAGYLAGEDVAYVFGRERVAGVYDAAAGPREIAGQLLHAAAAVFFVALLTDARALLPPTLRWRKLIDTQRLFGARIEIFGNSGHSQSR